MKLISDINRKIGRFVLNKELKLLSRPVVYNNFVSSSTVGLIFDAEDKTHLNLSKTLMDYIEERGIKVFGLAFVSKSALIGYFPYRKGVDYFGLDKLNWYGKPLDEGIEEFIERPFDILIDISLSELYPIEYVFALSKAKFKICNDSTKQQFADFILKLEKPHKLELFIEQVKHYLETIETKQYTNYNTKP